MRRFYIPIVMALALGGCGTLTELVGDNALGQLQIVQDAVAKGDQLTTEGADKLAIAADKYCGPLGQLPRRIVRDKVNERMLVLGSKYRLNNFCAQVPAGTPANQ